ANRLGTQCPQAKFVLAKTIRQLHQIMLGSIVSLIFYFSSSQILDHDILLDVYHITDFALILFT
ncbi:MAG: hypothetical protein WA631_17855, partial [Nitrososphaeraceae archaeon]